MNKVRITAVRQTVYSDLMEKFERSTPWDALLAKNPIEHACDMLEGQLWIWPSLSPSRLGNSSEVDCSRCSVDSIDGKQFEGMCPSTWYSMREFVESLARGEGDFYDGWMKNLMSAMISCRSSSLAHTRRVLRTTASARSVFILR